MELTFYGHGCIGLEWGDKSLLVDPFPPDAIGGQLEYQSIEGDFTWGLKTHSHPDHSAFDQIDGTVQKRLDRSGSDGPGVTIRRVTSTHDEAGGGIFGGAVSITQIEAGGYTVAHGADLGRSPGSIPKWLKNNDIFCLPVGGCFTAGASQAFEWLLRSNPAIMLPVHFGIDGRTQLGLDTVDVISSYDDDVVIRNESTLDCDRQLSKVDEKPRIICLEPLC